MAVAKIDPSHLGHISAVGAVKLPMHLAVFAASEEIGPAVVTAHESAGDHRLPAKFFPGNRNCQGGGRNVRLKGNQHCSSVCLHGAGVISRAGMFAATGIVNCGIVKEIEVVVLDGFAALQSLECDPLNKAISIWIGKDMPRDLPLAIV